MPKPRLKNYPNHQTPDGHAQAQLSAKNAGAYLDACVLHSGKIRFDVADSNPDEPTVRVNIREEQSFHPAMILMPREVDVLKAVYEHHFSLSEARSWTFQIIAKLDQMGLIDGKISATSLDSEGNSISDCRMMEITAAGQYILERAKERGL